MPDEPRSVRLVFGPDADLEDDRLRESIVAAAEAIAVCKVMGSCAPTSVAASSASTPVLAAVSPKRESGVCSRAKGKPW